jgi:hypothetical protein
VLTLTCSMPRIILFLATCNHGSDVLLYLGRYAGRGDTSAREGTR